MSAEGFIFDGALWVAVLIAMLAGLISFVSPCVLPLVPGYFGYLGSSLSTSSPLPVDGCSAGWRCSLPGSLWCS